MVFVDHRKVRLLNVRMRSTNTTLPLQRPGRDEAMCPWFKRGARSSVHVDDGEWTCSRCQCFSVLSVAQLPRKLAANQEQRDGDSSLLDGISKSSVCAEWVFAFEFISRITAFDPQQVPTATVSTVFILLKLR